MIVYLLYNKATESERTIEALHERLMAEHLEAELVDADSPRGIQLAENYEIMGRPAILVVRADGSPVQTWQGVENLPLISEVAYYARQ